MAEGIRTQDIIVLIVYLVIIILAAYYLTKLVGKKSMQKGMKKASSNLYARKRIQQNNLVYVVDRIPVDREKSIMVVEFENHYYLVGVTQSDFRLLDKKEISKEELIKRAREIVLEKERQETQTTQGGENNSVEKFSNKFFVSFKHVAGNYFKKDKKDISFDTKLQNELNKQDIKGSTDNKDINTKQ